MMQFVANLSTIYAAVAAAQTQASTLARLELLRKCVAELETMYERVILGGVQ